MKEMKRKTAAQTAAQIHRNYVLERRAKLSGMSKETYQKQASTIR